MIVGTYTLRTNIEKIISRNRQLYIAFLDLTAAFDNVHLEEICRTLIEMKIPIKLINNIKSVYENAKGCVRINGKISKTFKWSKGLKQGDSLSPLLFTILIDKITKICNNKCRSRKTKVGHWHMKPIYTSVDIR